MYVLYIVWGVNNEVWYVVGVVGHNPFHNHNHTRLNARMIPV